MHQIPVHRIRLFGRRRDRNIVLRAICDQIGAALEFPIPPRRDDLDVGLQGVVGQLKPNLIVAFSRCAVGDGVGTFLLGDLDLSFLAITGRASDVPSR